MTTTTKEVDRAKVRALVIEWTGAADPDDLTPAEATIVTSTMAQIDGWLARGDGVAVYRCQALDRRQLGDTIFVSYGSEDAQLGDVEHPPAICPDIGHQLYGLWGYCLEAWHRPQRGGEP